MLFLGGDFSRRSFRLVPLVVPFFFFFSLSQRGLTGAVSLSKAPLTGTGFFKSPSFKFDKSAMTAGGIRGCSFPFFFFFFPWTDGAGSRGLSGRFCFSSAPPAVGGFGFFFSSRCICRMNPSFEPYRFLASPRLTGCLLSHQIPRVPVFRYPGLLTFPQLALFSRDCFLLVNHFCGFILSPVVFVLRRFGTVPEISPVLASRWPVRFGFWQAPRSRIAVFFSFFPLLTTICGFCWFLGPHSSNFSFNDTPFSPRLFQRVPIYWWAFLRDAHFPSLGTLLSSSRTKTLPFYFPLECLVFALGLEVGRTLDLLFSRRSHECSPGAYLFEIAAVLCLLFSLLVLWRLRRRIDSSVAIRPSNFF